MLKTTTSRPRPRHQPTHKTKIKIKTSKMCLQTVLRQDTVSSIHVKNGFLRFFYLCHVFLTFFNVFYFNNVFYYKKTLELFLYIA